jgi:hypothetical protein
MGVMVPEPSATFSYRDLLHVRLKAYRNGGWRRLGGFEKAFSKQPWISPGLGVG